jgi:hypothetical protein
MPIKIIEAPILGIKNDDDLDLGEVRCGDIRCQRCLRKKRGARYTEST